MQMTKTAISASQSASQQLFEAATLMGVGMVTVFTFLVLLIVAMRLLALLVKSFPGPDIVAPSSRKAKPANNTIPPQTVAAITAAIHQHRQHKS